MVVQQLFSSQVQIPKMSYVTMLNRQRVQAFGMLGNSIQMRNFASLPDHIKLEMPNLSPTMEKVSYI
jgi:hypothetical protein